MEERMIRAQTVAVRLACTRITTRQGAALEMEKHLRSLVYMWRLMPSGRKATASVTPT